MPSVAQLERISTEDVEVALAAPGPRGVLARGAGRSYGDAAQNGGGRVVELEAGAFQPPTDTGVLEVDAAATLDALLRFIVPRGWFVPVTPGTRFVTLGGAVASDVHGKNHHIAGSFGDHVIQLEMVLADGSRRIIDRSSSLFWATIGGMGLTGIISRLRLQLIPIESASMVVETSVAADLDQTFAELDRGGSAPYSVAWIDTMASGRRFGRGVVSLGRHAAAHEALTDEALRYEPEQRFGVPALVSRNLLQNIGVQAFNRAWYGRAAARGPRAVESISTFFHPLDAVADWNRLYGRSGFVQHQMVVPDHRREAIAEALHALSAAGHPSFLSVLKRLGPSSGGLLSFPMPGWTLAVDVPNRGSATGHLLDRLDGIALRAGGRVNLAKDSNLTAERFAAMYSRLPEWQQVRDEFDPSRRFRSDLARRLRL
jgi:decaprenylphospho-beta-D-ribofuranose 2-oxidase